MEKTKLAKKFTVALLLSILISLTAADTQEIELNQNETGSAEILWQNYFNSSDFDDNLENVFRCVPQEENPDSVNSINNSETEDITDGNTDEDVINELLSESPQEYYVEAECNETVNTTFNTDNLTLDSNFDDEVKLGKDYSLDVELNSTFDNDLPKFNNLNLSSGGKLIEQSNNQDNSFDTSDWNSSHLEHNGDDLNLSLSVETEQNNSIEVLEQELESELYVLDFEGYVVNSTGSTFEADFDIPDSSLNFSTNDNGYFSEEIPYFRNDLMIDFDSNATLRLGGFEFVEDPDTSNISINYYGSKPENSSIDEDIDFVNLVGIEIGYPFDPGSSFSDIEIEYDRSKGNPEEIEVYECDWWNIDAEECHHDWDGPFDDMTTTWQARTHLESIKSFETSESNRDVVSNAYMVAMQQEENETDNNLTEDDLDFLDPDLEFNSTELSADTVDIGDEVEFSGSVMVEDGNATDEANVSLEFDSFERNTVTDEEGFFEIIFDAPENNGTHELDIEANKEDFDPAKTSENLTINKRSELEISSADGQEHEISPGSRDVVTLTVENNGHTNITDLNISETQIEDEDQYSLDKTGFTDYIETGDAGTLTFTSFISTDFCRSEGCEYIEINIVGSDEKGDVEEAYGISIDFEENETEASAMEEESNQSIIGRVSDLSESFDQGSSDLNPVNSEYVEELDTVDFLMAGLVLMILAVIFSDNIKNLVGGASDDRRFVRSNAPPIVQDNVVKRPDISSEDKEDQ